MSNESFTPMDTVTYFRSSNSKRKKGEPRMLIGEVVKRCSTHAVLVRFKSSMGEDVYKRLLATQLELGRRPGAQERL